MEAEQGEHLVVEDEGGGGAAHEGAGELQQAAEPGGHGEPGEAHPVGGPVGAGHVQGGQPQAPHVTQQPEYRL